MKFSSRAANDKFAVGTDFLWLCIILVGSIFITSIIPLEPNDFWWHLKIGEWIFTHGTIPSTNMYAWSLPPDTPYYYGTWLGELSLYLIYYLGGLELTLFIRTLLLGVTFFLVACEAKRRSGSWRLAAGAVGLGFLMTLSNVQVRTQIWSWIPFTIYLILLSRYTDRRTNKYWLLLLPVLMIFWVNAHGAFILGLVLIGIFLLGESLSLLLKQPLTLQLKDIRWLALIGLLTVLATLCNPRFFNIGYYVLDLMTDQPSQQLVIEWQSPTPQGLNNISFFISILILLSTLVYTKYRLRATELLAIISYLWLAWSGVRYIVWYAIVGMPVLATLWAYLPIKKPAFQPVRNSINTLLVLLLLVPVILVQPWFVEKVPFPETYTEQVLRGTSIGPLLSVDTPVAAVDHLLQHPGGNLFNEMGYGSYLIWAIPEQGVFVDPRVELYPFEQWQGYRRVSAGINYNQILSQYGVDRLLLNKSLQMELIQALEKDTGWQLEYEDQYSQIWDKVSDTP